MQTKKLYTVDDIAGRVGEIAGGCMKRILKISAYWWHTLSLMYIFTQEEVTKVEVFWRLLAGPFNWLPV